MDDPQIVVEPVDGRTVYAAFMRGNKSSQYVARSDDFGQTCGKPSGDVNLYVTKSTDGGLTWTTSRVDVSGAPPPCGCSGWAYWAAQMTLAVDASDRLYVLYNAGPSKGAKNRMLFARSDDGGVTWSAETQLSQFVAGYGYKPADGFLEPYGDYFELDVDGAGKTHALWGEGPSYDGPGNVWYAGQ